MISPEVMRLRHAGFNLVEFRDDSPYACCIGWVRFDHGAILRWECDGLQHVAQWTQVSGLHIFTPGMHRNCFRVVCPWPQARRIVEIVRNYHDEQTI